MYRLRPVLAVLMGTLAMSLGQSQAQIMPIPVWTGPGTLGNSVMTQNANLIGVATTTPQGTLHVVSGAGFNTPQARLTQTTPEDYARLRFDSFGTEPDTGAAYPWPIWDIAAGNCMLNIYDQSFGNVMTFRCGNGRVGIGTTNPSCALDVVGNFCATGTKTALVATASHGKRLLYAVESPENWFEDFGSADLVQGRAVIKLDTVFAETVNTDKDYHVFLTPKGDCEGLYVTNQTATLFEVRELRKGNHSVSFDYRIVAKRRGYEQVRLAEVRDETRAQPPHEKSRPSSPDSAKKTDNSEEP